MGWGNANNTWKKKRSQMVVMQHWNSSSINPGNYEKVLDTSPFSSSLFANGSNAQMIKNSIPFRFMFLLIQHNFEGLSLFETFKRYRILFFKVKFSVLIEQSSHRRCKFKILVETVKSLGCKKQFCICSCLYFTV